MRSVLEEYDFLYRVGIFLVVLLLGLLMYAFLTWAWNSPAELGAYDMLMRLRPAPPVRNDVAIVAIDAKTTGELGQLPWSRAVHARIVRALNAAGAKSIVYDMHFAQPDTAHPGADRALWNAMTAGKNVFMPMVYDPLRTAVWSPADMRGLFNLEKHALTERITYTTNTPMYRYYYFVPPWADYVGAARGIGTVVTPPAASSVVRGVQLAYLTNVRYPVPSTPLARNTTLPKLNNQTVVLQGLPLIVSRAIFDVENQRTEVNFGRDITLLADLEPYVQIPIDSAGGMLVNYSGPAGTYPNYSAVDLLNGNIDRSTFANKIVIVGVTDPASPYTATLNTPYTPMPRAEVTANSIGTILNRAYIVRNIREGLAVLLVLALILGLTLPFFNRWNLGVVALAISLAYIVVAVLVMMIFRHAFPVIPALVLILLSSVVTALLSPLMFADEVVEEPVRRAA